MQQGEHEPDHDEEGIPCSPPAAAAASSTSTGRPRQQVAPAPQARLARRGSLEKGNGRTEEELALAAVERLPEILPCARAAVAAD